MRLVAGRGAVLEKLAGALMRMAGVFLAELQLAVRAVAQKYREEASGKRVQDWQPRARQGNRVHGWQRDARWKRRCTTGKEMHDGRGVARRASTAAPGEPLAHRTAGRGTLLLFGWCAEGVHLVYYFHWDAEDSVQLFVCGGVMVAEEPYYCNELVVGYLTEWLVVSLV